MAETRVNLKHLLEDLKDAYPAPAEEVIVTELVANALDSGASAIRFLVQPAGRTLTVIDDGKGMARNDFARYHDIAATTKTRGRGIGFAGVGAKLALLLAERVVTESRRGRRHFASRWRLEGDLRAPWARAKPAGMVETGSGTAVTVVLRDERSPLLRPEYVEDVVRRHFAPLLNPRLMADLLRSVYRRGVALTVNARPLQPRPMDALAGGRLFHVREGARSRLIGAGLVGAVETPLQEAEQGIAVATYGKVIKRGWEWLGLTPKDPGRITGLVEVPQLAGLLSTNKAEFLRDGPSLWRYYRIRRSVLRALVPVLAELGEAPRPREQTRETPRAVERDLNRALGGLAGEFPELGALLGARRAGPLATGGGPGAGEVEAVAAPEPAADPGSRTEPDEPERVRRRPDEAASGARRGGGLKIEYEDRPDRPEPSWLAGETVRVNRAHPAYRRAVEEGAQGYHLALATAWALAAHLEAAKDPREFINRFMAEWGRWSETASGRPIQAL